MSRWEPNTETRLEQAALDLYRERGYEQTTVAEIAERAGLTERTYFRYFADKREVLFRGQTRLKEIAIDAIARHPANAAPLDIVMAALAAMGDAIPNRTEFSRQRLAVIAANTELQERELLKRASLAAIIAEGLQHRGITAPAARLLAETGMTVFHVAFAQWISESGQQKLSLLLLKSLDELKVVMCNNLQN